MNHYQRLVSDEIASVQAQKAYSLSALSAEGLEGWERKEYSTLVEQYDQALIELNARLQQARLGGEYNSTGESNV